MIEINEEVFKDVCNNSKSMGAACAKLQMNWKTFRRYAIKLGCFKTNQSGKGQTKNQPSVPIADILSNKVPCQSFKLKIKLFKEGLKENKCECCGISEWNGKPLNCELHHIDGNNSNNNLDNLIILCPNCHSQTENFRSKNKK